LFDESRSHRERKKITTTSVGLEKSRVEITMTTITKKDTTAANEMSVLAIPSLSTAVIEIIVAMIVWFTLERKPANHMAETRALIIEGIWLRVLSLALELLNFYDIIASVKAMILLVVEVVLGKTLELPLWVQ